MEARRATVQLKLKQTLGFVLIGFILGALLVPLIARAVTIKDPGHYPHASAAFGVALEVDGMIDTPAKAGNALPKSRVPDTSGISALSEAEMLDYIRHRESSGNPTAQNPESSAYGHWGFLDSTWRTVGCVKTSDPIEQERCALLYMEQRYGGIEGAYWFHVAHDWY